MNRIRQLIEAAEAKCVEAALAIGQLKLPDQFMVSIEGQELIVPMQFRIEAP